MNELETTTINSTKKGASVAARLYKSDLQVDTKKSKLDYVTNADIKSQSTIIRSIKSAYSQAKIICEENNNKAGVPKSGNYWVVDPIDGTSNFVVGSPFWATSVAVIRNNETKAVATIAPALSEIYSIKSHDVFYNGEQVSVSSKKKVDEFTVSAVLRYGTDLDRKFSDLLKHSLLKFGDVRRLGSAQLTFGMVARGALDACIAIQPDPNPWDTIAGVELVRKAGGEVTDIFGDPWSPNSHGVIATNGNAHQEILSKLKHCLP
jgi:myo-inositol-1(or 4)-monophosphatase